MVPRLKPCRSSSAFLAGQLASGSVTLKKASLATFSKGPGVSMEAVVSARMKGGVSSTIAELGLFGRPTRVGQRHVEESLFGHFLEGPRRIHGGRGQRAHEGRRLLDDRRHHRRDGDDPALLDVFAQAAERAAKRLEQLAGRGVIVFETLEDLLRRALGIDLPRHLVELRLVAAQVLVAEFEQAVERNIHHLVVEQLLAVVLRADAEIAARSRQKIVLEIRLIGLESVEYALVGLLEFRLERSVRDLPERRGDIVLKEAHDPRQLLQRHLGVNARRILQVLAGRLKHPGNQPLARDCQFQPLRGRSIVAAHDDEDRVGYSGGVKVRVLLPGANRFQRQKPPANLRQRQLAVRRDDGREAARIEVLKIALEFSQGGDFRLDIGPRHGRKLGVVLVEARLRTLHGIETEEDFVEKPVGQFVELRVAGLCKRRGGQREKEKDLPGFHGFGEEGNIPSIIAAAAPRKFTFNQAEPRPICTNMEFSDSAVRGLKQEEKGLEQAKTRVASAGGTPNGTGPVDTVDLSDSMVAMLTARQEFTANLNAFKTADEIQRQTIDLLARSEEHTSELQ